VRESGGCDEHTLRERLMAEAAADPIGHVILTVPDWIADAEGLYQADFDLLTRIPGLHVLDIVSTDRVLASGFHERLHTWWPGLDEVHAEVVTEGVLQASVGGRPASRPALITPPNASPDEPWWTLRDREEELVAIARRLKADRRIGDAVPLARAAIVYKHPLPCAAAEIFRAAGIPYQMSDVAAGGGADVGGDRSDTDTASSRFRAARSSPCCARRISCSDLTIWRGLRPPQCA
jgi:hypothetical protein